jgi:hypothetical protein
MSTAPAVTEYVPWWFNTPLGGAAAALLAGSMYSGLVGIFVPPRPRGSGRLIALVATVLTLVAVLVAWVDVFTDSSSVGYWMSLGTAVGVTVGGLGMLGVRRLAGRASGAPASRPPGHQFWFEYLVGAWLCFLGLRLGSEYTHLELDRTVESWFAGWGIDVAFYGASGAVQALGFAYSQLVAAAAVRALNTALGDDWQLARNLHYALLAPPFVLATVWEPAPSIVAGAVAQLVSLLVCWRYTDDRPKTPLQTLKWLLARCRRRRTTMPAVKAGCSGPR